jgi:uncharacterized Zn finger protein (UPF0148 family)
MREVMARRWTDEEQQRLFDVYFSPQPGWCPVCGQEVYIVMTSLREGITLSLTCPGCGNKERISRASASFPAAWANTPHNNIQPAPTEQAADS